MNPVVLSFHEALLHQSDINLLNGNHWLNDNILTFYFEYLEKIVYKDSKELLFIGPEVTQCLKISAIEELAIFLDPLQAEKKNFIFMALNNCENPAMPGGTHWSLLVFSKPEDCFYHFDSSSGYNNNQARKLAGKLSKYFSSRSEEFQETDSLQQANSYDCGIHLICNVENLANYCKQSKKVKGCPLVKRMIVNTKRHEILELIDSLKSP